MAIAADNLQELDYRHLWHPYTDIGTYESSPHVVFDSGEGSYLYTTDGRKLLDGIASWWAVAFGHSHPDIVRAIREQAGILQHSILGNLAHPQAIRLAARLAAIAPGDLNHCYFASDGASATEAAMKIAIQYWYNIGEKGRNRFATIAEGYHGDTLAAVGVGFVPTFHKPFEDAVIRAYTAPSPHRPANPDAEADAAHAREAFGALERIVEKHGQELAGIILEPLCQGAAGIWIYPESYLRDVRALCDAHGIPLIADEIAVGFGRTGAMFACERAGIVPDLLCVGKALTGGYLPMSAAIASDRIYETFRNTGERDCTFYDGHTYCGNPITSAAALAALDLFEEIDVANCVQTMSQLFDTAFAEIAEHESVAYAKTLGGIAMCAFNEQSGGAARAKTVARTCMERGLFVRPLGPSLYLWPPFTTSEAELDTMIGTFTEAL